MTRFDTPLLHLAEPAPRQATHRRVHLLDTVCLITILALVLGAALFVIDMAGSRSSGEETGSLSRLLSSLSVGVPALLAAVGKYGMLLLASIVNSTVIVLLVTALRTLDRRVGRMTNRRLSRFGPVRRMQTLGHPRSAARSTRVVRSREAETYLLSPVFR
jgi:hypothetical protein